MGLMARLWTNLVILLSLAVLAGVVFYFGREYYAAKRRHQVLADLKKVSTDEGPCAALEAVRALPRPLDPDLGRSVESRRVGFAAEVVGSDDRQAQSALLSSDLDGLVDRTLCEQIKLTRELGEPHPLLELLRFTREGGDPCDDPQGLDQVLKSLTSHRTQMLHALMAQVARLQCLPPWLATRLADEVLSAVQDTPNVMDDVDALRLAKFLNAWAPVRAAQFACMMDADGRPSLLAGAIGCTPYLKRQVLPRFRYGSTIAASDKGPELPAGSEVLLLSTEGERCQVRPATDPPRLAVVACRELTPMSDVHLAVLVESVAYGLARASLVAGMIFYDPLTQKLMPSRKEPDYKSWYGYSRDGEALGMAQTVRLSDLAQRLGEDVPETPLRTFCRQAGAKYCYDVDWAQVVDHLDGEPVVFLSRPTPVFLAEGTVPRDVSSKWVSEAFGRTAQIDRTLKTFLLPKAGALIVAIQPGGLDLRWRLAPNEPWKSQSYGVFEGGRAPPSARLLAVMDLRGDGKPEVLMQRIKRATKLGELKDVMDEVVLVGVDATGKRFETVNALTVHEY
jgi:hypothetical protein